MKKGLSVLFFVLSSLFFSIAVAAPINVNSADAEAISQALLGVGPAKAQAIVDYRQANGPFKTVDDLLKVKGIGPAILKKNRDDILLTDSKVAAPKK
ncbi:MAG: ComEA family DNA-binding protein [Gammaproteobacteria bacterium]|nr:ComEA family DNA-binding protein [Gammaproteobacteria bacterium]MBU1656275.1 ComEA family DNA-binding protein [Gammaproteobacteria bacterium]MBU1959840.1 ComEA family DNA-binding protein [Gammaproteobacteria bacterium]